MTTDSVLNYGAYATIDLVIRRGCSVATNLKFYQENGEVQSLTGWTARMSFRSKAGGDLWLDLTSASGITITGAIGEVDIALTPAQTRAMAGKRGEYDLLLKNAAGTEVVCPIAGTFLFEDVVSAAP